MDSDLEKAQTSEPCFRAIYGEGEDEDKRKSKHEIHILHLIDFGLKEGGINQIPTYLLHIVKTPSISLQYSISHDLGYSPAQLTCYLGSCQTTTGWKTNQVCNRVYTINSK